MEGSHTPGLDLLSLKALSQALSTGCCMEGHTPLRCRSDTPRGNTLKEAVPAWLTLTLLLLTPPPYFQMHKRAHKLVILSSI